MAKVNEQAAVETAKYSLSPVQQSWPAFMPGQQQAIANQLFQGYGNAPAVQGGMPSAQTPNDYMSWLSNIYQPMNFQQYRSPVPTTPDAGGGSTVDPAMTWALYKEQYKHGDGSLYPAGMNQKKFDAWLATQGTTPTAPAASPAASMPAYSPLNGVMGATAPAPRPYYTTMDGRDAYLNTGQIGGLF